MPVADVLAAITDWKARSPQRRTYRAYVEGRHRQAFSSEAFEKLFREVLEEARENLCPAAVKVFTNRLTITGWEGPGAEAATKVFDEIGGTRVANMFHREAHRSGDGFVLVWPDAAGNDRPWPHRAEQVALKLADDDPGEFEWVAKVMVTPEGHGRVNLYYDDVVERWITTRKVREGTGSSTTWQWPDKAEGWDPYDDDGDPDTIGHEYGRVPWVWLPRDADTFGDYGKSVLRDVIPIQDALNKSVADLIVGGESFALPLRAILNFQPQQKLDPETGKPVQQQIKYDIRKNRLLGIPGNGPLTQLDPPDATKLTALHDAYALKIARVIGAPAYEFTQGGSDVPSGISLRVLADRRTAAIRDFQEDANPAWSRLMDLLGVPDARPSWADPAPLDATEQLEAAEKKRDLGFPFETLAAELGYDETELKDILKARLREEAEAAEAGQVAARAFDTGRTVREVME